jgi:RNA polymerase sigma factor (sigma-70 family)
MTSQVTTSGWCGRMNSLTISRKSRAVRLPDVSVKQPFDAVVEVHGATVLRVCRAVLGPADADDAWSETFLSALKAYPDLPADANVQAWLVTIAHRKTIDVTRARARRAVPVDVVPETPAPVAAEADDDLADAVARLPTKQKQAVVYHYLAGLPYADIAAVLGGTPAAARRAGADGIAALRRSYPSAPNTSTTAKRGGTP